MTGLDPERGEPVTYGVTVSGQRGTIRLQNERYEFTLQDLSDPDFRLPGLDPMPLEPVTLESLYQNNTGPLRINYLTYPQVGDATQTVELLLSGVLVCMSACALLPVVPAIHTEAEMQKMETLVALGATDGQILAVLFLEVWMLLIFSGVLGSLLGMGLSAWAASPGDACAGCSGSASAAAWLPVQYSGRSSGGYAARLAAERWEGRATKPAGCARRPPRHDGQRQAWVSPSLDAPLLP